MKKFKFKLARVLQYRFLLEGIAKSAYKESLLELHKKINKLKEMETKRISVRKGLKIKKGMQIDPQTIEFVSIYVKQLAFLIEIQKDVIGQQRLVTEKKLSEWTLRRKDSKVIKKLEEKQKKEYIEMSEKEEQKFLDDIFLAKKVKERQISREEIGNEK